MQTAQKTALELVHRLLFQALLEIREQGQTTKNTVTFHLANLFHNAVLDMQLAAEGDMSYDDILTALEEKAVANGCERWLNTTREKLESDESV